MQIPLPFPSLLYAAGPPIKDKAEALTPSALLFPVHKTEQTKRAESFF